MSRRPAIAGEGRWFSMLALVCLALGQAVAMVVTAFATRDVITVLRAGSEAVPFTALVTITLSGLVIFALRSVEGALGERTGQSYAAAIRRALFLHMTKMPLSAMAERRAGATSLRFVGDLTAFKGWVARGLTRLISSCVTIPAAFLILYLLDPWLALVAAGPIAMVIAAIYLLGAPLGQAHADLRSKRARLAASMAEKLPQGIALRRSGRVRTELRALDKRSSAIVRAAVRRAWLAETVRAMPDAAAGAAGALCLWVCLTLKLGIADAVAALTALALIVWPLRHLADVRDRQKAFGVARAKLDATLATPRLPTLTKAKADRDAPAIQLTGLVLPGLAPIDLTLARGATRALSGPPGSGKSRLLLMLAGLEACADKGSLQTLGANPAAQRSGSILYLGPEAPILKGSLRRNMMLGTGRKVPDSAIAEVVQSSGLSELIKRLGGLGGQVAEGARNLTGTERTRLFLARGLIARPQLALIDADEIGLNGAELVRLLDHFRQWETASLVVTSEQIEHCCDCGPLLLKKRNGEYHQHVSRDDTYSTAPPLVGISKNVYRLSIQERESIEGEKPRPVRI